MRIANKKNTTEKQKNTNSKEKQKLIRKIVDSRAENQQSILDLKKKSSAYDVLLSEKLKMEQLHSENMDAISSQLNAMQTELAALKIQFSKKESEYNFVTHENQTLKARIKQLQTSQQQTASTSDSVQNISNHQPDVYEIEKIVAHKKKKNGLHFRVGWENFAVKDDTWEHESNVMCIVCKYMQKLHLN